MRNFPCYFCIMGRAPPRLLQQLLLAQPSQPWSDPQWESPESTVGDKGRTGHPTLPEEPVTGEGSPPEHPRQTGQPGTAPQSQPLSKCALCRKSTFFMFLTSIFLYSGVHQCLPSEGSCGSNNKPDHKWHWGVTPGKARGALSMRTHRSPVFLPHTNLLSSQMSPDSSGPSSKERTHTFRAKTCQKHQHGPVTRLVTKLAQSLGVGGPVSCTSLLFKGKTGLWCLLFAQSWRKGLEGAPHCAEMDMPCPFSDPQNPRKPAPRSAQGTHFNCSHREAEMLWGAEMYWAVQTWGLVCCFRKLISTEFYSCPLAPWALWWSFVTTAQKKRRFSGGQWGIWQALQFNVETSHTVK